MPSSTPVTKKLVFFNKVLEDGLGDLGHLIDIASPSMLKSLLPATDRFSNAVVYQPIYVVVCANPTPYRVRFIIDSLKENGMINDLNNPYDFKKDNQIKNYVAHVLDINPHFIFAGETYLSEESKNNIPDLYTISKMRIFDASAAFLISHIEEHSINELMHSIVYPTLCTKISEHGKRIGAFYRSRFQHAYTMGFFPKNCGVLLKKLPKLTLEDKAAKLINIHNKTFLNRLIGIKKEEIASLKMAIGFLERNLFVPGYIQNELATTVFIQSIAGSELSKKYFDVIFNIRTKDFNISLLDHVFLANQGFSKIIIHDSNSGAREITIKNAKSDRNLIVFIGYELDNDDYHDLFKIAQIFGGCSGDKTLELVLSNYLIPFYQEQRRGKFASESFGELAKTYFDNINCANILAYINFFSKFRNLPRDELTHTSELMMALINSEFAEQWTKLISEIHINHNFYDRLPLVLEAPIRTHDFYQAHAEDILQAINEKDYRKALDLLSEFDPASPDLRCIMRWAAISHKFKAISAFIWAAIVRDEPKKDYLDRSPEEIRSDKKTGIRPEDIDRSQAEQLDKQMIKYGFDKLDLKSLLRDMTLHKSSEINISNLPNSIFHREIQSKQDENDAPRVELDEFQKPSGH